MPYDVGMASGDCLFHSSFARDQICSLPGASHSVRMCSMDSSDSQWAPNPFPASPTYFADLHSPCPWFPHLARLQCIDNSTLLPFCCGNRPTGHSHHSALMSSSPCSDSSSHGVQSRYGVCDGNWRKVAFP